MKNINFETWVIDLNDRLKKKTIWAWNPDAKVLLSGDSTVVVSVSLSAGVRDANAGGDAAALQLRNAREADEVRGENKISATRDQNLYESETESAHVHFPNPNSAQKVHHVFWQARGAKKRENSSYSPGSVMLFFFLFFLFFRNSK